MIRNYGLFKSIRSKASLLFLALFLIIIFPILYIIFSRVETTLASADTKELTAEGEKLFSQVILDPMVIPLPPNGYLLKLQFYKDVYSEDIFVSPGFPELDKELFLLPVLEYDTLKLINISRVNSGDSRIILSLARSNSRLLSQLNDLRFYIFLTSIASVVFAAIMVFVAAGIMLRPLQKIIGVAAGINASNSIARVPVPDTIDESRVLAETLNAMLSRIETTIKNQINFFASATHELKTPLAVMQTELSVSISSTNDKRTKQILENQLIEVQRLDRTIHDFLLMSQLKSDSLTLRLNNEKLEEVVYSAVKQVKYLSEDRQTKINIQLTEIGSVIPVDFDKMQTVFANLMENAIKYSPASSTIAVAVSNDSVTIVNVTLSEIADPHLLVNEFRRSSELSSGLGMGLWLSDQIVKLHHARLIISSGSKTFTARVEFTVN